MSPRANAIIKSKKRVLSFAGKGSSRRIGQARPRARAGAADSDGDSDDDGDGDGDDDGDGDADDGGDKPKPKPRKPEPLPVGSDLFTTRQSATYLNVSPQLLDKLRHKGGGPAYVKIGDLVRYAKAELDRFIAVRTFKNTAQGINEF